MEGEVDVENSRGSSAKGLRVSGGRKAKRIWVRPFLGTDLDRDGLRSDDGRTTATSRSKASREGYRVGLTGSWWWDGDRLAVW